MCSEPTVSFAPLFPQMNAFQGYLFQHAANLHALENHFNCQGVLSHKSEKVISLIPAITVAEHCDLHKLDEAIQTQFPDAIAKDSSPDLQADQENADGDSAQEQDKSSQQRKVT